ncbi:MAG: family 20 glycosylhydrolase [Fibrobacter sp.]|nr:family 20 glycosylhydrolase [Fibrobacter sp.]
MYLIPQVKKLTFINGIFSIDPGDKIYVPELSEEYMPVILTINKTLEKRMCFILSAESPPDIYCKGIYFCKVEAAGPEDYTLSVSREKIEITGKGEEAFFRAVQTLCQIIDQCGREIPCLYIEDSPDFPCRGFYHDITRGKVPRLDTLKWLAERLAYYKFNQMQLYIEHTFAFRNIPELWKDKSPVTAEEIRELDSFCRSLHIELVPSLSTFGHLYELLRLKRFEHLNELDIKASEIPHNLWDRMAHYTIDPSNPESFALIESMITELLPLFSSKYFNICCDETFDLGKGKNFNRAEKIGVGRIYVDFVKKIAGVVIKNGKIPMMWGDIVLNHPDLIGELPPEMVFLNWGYDPDIDEEGVKLFAEKGLTQYCCPGARGWSRFSYDIENASLNIRRMISHGYSFNARGILLTDWGDCGHVNFLSGALHGAMLAAALSWNHESYSDDKEFDHAASVVEWGEQSRTLYNLLRELGSLYTYHFGNIYAWIINLQGLWNREEMVKEMDSVTLVENFRRAGEIADAISGLDNYTYEKYGELFWSARAVQWTLGLLCFKKVKEYGQKCELPISKENLIKTGRLLTDEFIDLWMKRNKESELKEVVRIFNAALEKVGSLG